ncbi:hypothetical protein M501DRAFT_373040 [Patellaria atrata CBS 101060]|uniref:Uncharacterized protein n=1 Tax=Patellaria atrata CBS 101060 TaxID=1346257 RepID=A0A9P4SFK9_9PEZI|nr:hypothetical protein M501DRAFT_373040 [Patellaria atrata CBS 101060]
MFISLSFHSHALYKPTKSPLRLPTVQYNDWTVRSTSTCTIPPLFRLLTRISQFNIATSLRFIQVGYVPLSTHQNLQEHILPCIFIRYHAIKADVTVLYLTVAELNTHLVVRAPRVLVLASGFLSFQFFCISHTTAPFVSDSPVPFPQSPVL